MDKDTCIETLVIRGALIMARFLEGERSECIYWLEKKSCHYDVVTLDNSNDIDDVTRYKASIQRRRIRKIVFRGSIIIGILLAVKYRIAIVNFNSYICAYFR